jgi:phosphatidylglycerophosphatase GEP4
MVKIRTAMVQSINTKALLTLASVVRRPFLAAPHVHVQTISEVNFQSMKDFCGIKAVIFDKDNTLTAPYATEIHEDAALGLKNAMDVFGHDNIAILSNSAGTKDDKDYEDAIKIERDMGINVIRHDEKKPGGLEEVLHHFADHGVENASEICMVGDRLLTDIVFGNLFGMLTVHCMPLCSGRDNKSDNKIASIIRTMENKLLYHSKLGTLVMNKRIPHAVWQGEEMCSLVYHHVKDSTNDNGNDNEYSEPLKQ